MASPTSPDPDEPRSSRQSPLAIDGDAFRALGHQLVDDIADLLERIPRGPVTGGETPQDVREAMELDGPLPEQGEDAATLLHRTAELLGNHSLFNGHPRFFGYITAGPAPIGVLGDFLASAVNANVGSWGLAPAATEIEAQTVRWIAELIGYPSDCGGLLVSGGNMANIIAFLAARAAGAGWDVRVDGVAAESQPKLRVYGSAETHTWIQKATDLSGLGTNAIQWIPTGRDLRMDVVALRRQIEVDVAAGLRPLLVVGTAGTVSTGAVDPLGAIAEICRKHQIWFHVDGAYGGFAAAVDADPDLRALREADSVAVDPHKWLYAPLEAGCALVRNREHLRQAFSYHPPYYHFDPEVTNYVDCGLQNSRGFRALKVWLALRQAGAGGYRKMIADDIALSRHMATVVASEAELQLVSQALSIATFRYVPMDRRAKLGEPATENYLDTLNRTLLEDLQRGGEAFVSNAVIDGHFVLRACIVNFRTTTADVEALPGIVVRLGREVDRRLRQV
jgi:aromatic-L-amino-acid decarboxylase